MEKKQRKTKAKTRRHSRKDLLKTELVQIVKKAEDKDTVVFCFCCGGTLLKEIAKPVTFEKISSKGFVKKRGYLCPDCYRKIIAGETVKED